MAKNFKKIDLYLAGKGKKSSQGSGRRTKYGKTKGKIKKHRGQGGPRKSVKH
jgi:hypothetical protein